MKISYRSRAPLRLGLAGGGTDVSPFSNEFGGYVLNATIDLFTHAILEPRNDGKIIFEATDRNEKKEVKSTSVLLVDSTLDLHTGVYNKIVKEFNNNTPLSFNLKTFSDAPPGSGLGTSSTLVVCIIKVFCEWLNLRLSEYDIAKAAYEIERIDLKMSGGKQDQYTAAFGGFNFMEFGPGEDRVVVNPLRIKKWFVNELEVSTVLFFTGLSRKSATIIEDQIKSFKDKTSATYSSSLELKSFALRMKECILKDDIEGYKEILNNSWKSKKALSKSITNPFLNSIYEEAMTSGAEAGKISGAGGGGFFVFFVRPENRIKLISGLKKLKGEVINFHFHELGAESWNICQTI